jgi:hypothetical protein
VRRQTCRNVSRVVKAVKLKEARSEPHDMEDFGNSNKRLLCGGMV